MACMEHRAQAQIMSGITEAQKKSLALPRVKGKNYRLGYKHRKESKKLASDSHKKWCRENPDRVVARGILTRGEKHYKWKGGTSQLNKSIRVMSENRKWSAAVKARDKCCNKCGNKKHLESHHIKPLAELIELLEIKNRDDARIRADVLWDLANGETLCKTCHYSEHGRIINFRETIQ